MRARRTLLALVGLALALRTPLHAQADTYTWYRFKKAFITAEYKNGTAFGELPSSAWSAAKNPHSESCGGNDAELHIGVFDHGIDLPEAERPPSAPTEADDSWGLVAELPSAGDGDGPGTLKKLAGTHVSFVGYLRVWDEGHAQGSTAPSNPHHVLEVHPAWGFSSDSDSFEARALIRTMPSYSGYGASKFRRVLSSLAAKEWPKVYQDQDFIYVRLLRAENFYQLPVKVTGTQTIDGGHQATVDVYSDAAFKNLRYEGLRCMTATGSEYDDQWREGSQDFLLGFFSVNLRKCLDAVGAAASEEEALPVSDAAEFFVFGAAANKSVASCSK